MYLWQQSFSTVLLALSRADPDIYFKNFWGHASAPAKIILIYIIYEFTIFMAYLLKEPEQSVQGVKEW